MVTWKGPKSFFPLSGQYCWHLILLPSFTLVTMTMVGGRSCQISRQKSTTVLGRGPENKNSLQYYISVCDVPITVLHDFNIRFSIPLFDNYWAGWFKLLFLLILAKDDSNFVQICYAGPILNENGKVCLRTLSSQFPCVHSQCFRLLGDQFENMQLF